MPVCFLLRDGKGVDQGGRGCREDLEGVEGREIIISVYYIVLYCIILYIKIP